MKNLIFGLTALVCAFGFSAYKNVEGKNNGRGKSAASYWYLRHTDGTYEYVPAGEPAGCDEEETDVICAKEFSEFKDENIVTDTYSTNLVNTTYIPQSIN